MKDDIRDKDSKDVKIEAEVPITVVEPEKSVLKRLVPPHTKVSRAVTDDDIEKVVEEAKILHAICFESMGRYKGAYAMHHSQIDDKDPMSFYVTYDRKIIINPVITRHTNTPVDSKEACMSFPYEEEVIVPRWHKLEMDFVTIMSDPDNEGKFKLSSVQHEDLSGHQAFVAQHEIDHGEGRFIHPIK